MPHKNYDKLKVNTLPQGEAEVTGEIILPFLVSLRPKALKHLNEHLDLPGFRKGHIPEDILTKKVGEMAILEECAELALAEEYGNILKESRLSAIGRPQISITKLAPGIPLEFKIRVTLEPEFKLPDYKKIAKSIEEEKIEKNAKPEEKQRAQEMRRLKIIESLVKETEIAVPDLLVNAELHKMIGQFRDDVTRAGLKFEDYLKETNKTEDDLRKEWREKALERVKSELIIAKIAVEEKIEPEEKIIEQETKHLMEHFPDADPLRAFTYVYSLMRTQKVLEFLENLKS